jgi:hypothetical protein
VLEPQLHSSCFPWATTRHTSHHLQPVPFGISHPTGQSTDPPFPPTPLLSSNHNHGLQPLIWRDYRGDVEPSAIEKFYPLVMDTEEDVR